MNECIFSFIYCLALYKTAASSYADARTYVLVVIVLMLEVCQSCFLAASYFCRRRAADAAPLCECVDFHASFCRQYSAFISSLRLVHAFVFPLRALLIPPALMLPVTHPAFSALSTAVILLLSLSLSLFSCAVNL